MTNVKRQGYLCPQKPKGFVMMNLKNVISSIDDTPLVEGILKIRSALKIELVSRTELEALWDF